MAVHNQLAPGPKHHGGRAWQRTTAHVVELRKQREKGGDSDGEIDLSQIER